MPRVVVADTSCLILFSKINELHILHSVFGPVCVTEEIAIEFGTALPDWVEIVKVKDRKYLDFLMASLDLGEASAISYAMEQEICLLILDDYKGRRLAAQLGIALTGSLGVLIAARNLGLIPALKPYFQKIEETNFRIPQDIIGKILLDFNELE